MNLSPEDQLIEDLALCIAHPHTSLTKHDRQRVLLFLQTLADYSIEMERSRQEALNKDIRSVLRKEPGTTSEAAVEEEYENQVKLLSALSYSASIPEIVYSLMRKLEKEFPVK